MKLRSDDVMEGNPHGGHSIPIRKGKGARTPSETSLEPQQGGGGVES